MKKSKVIGVFEVQVGLNWSDESDYYPDRQRLYIKANSVTEATKSATDVIEVNPEFKNVQGYFIYSVEYQGRLY